MKKIKHILAAAAVATMMMISTVMTALADSNVTAEVNINGHENHTFKAIQIFKGTQEDGDDAELGNIVWGDDTTDKTTAIINAVNTVIGGSALPDNAEAKLVAERIATIADTTDSANLEKANALSKALDAVLNEVTGTTLNPGSTTLPIGYYLIVDTTNVGAGDALNMSLLQLTKDITITTKSDAPEIEKKLKNASEADTAWRDTNNVKIGDTVNYKITSEVPDMTYYDQYYFIVTDVLSKGLTFDDESIVVKVGDTKLTPTTEDDATGTTYKLTETALDGGNKIEIVFSDFKQYTKDEDVVITYNATLNEDAVIGTSGNPNEVQLTYSNNPNKKGDGTNKPDDDDEVTGVTPKDYTITYTNNIKIKKIDASTKEVMPGVQFTLKGYYENDVVTYTEEFIADESGEYYKLADGTYTTKVPTALTSSQYDSASTKYKLTVTKSTDTEVIPVEKTATTDDNGMIDIGKILSDRTETSSLSAGKFVITEAQTLAGYNLLDEAVIVELKHNDNDHANGKDVTVDNGTTTCTWTSSKGTWVAAEDAFVIEIENSKGSKLPETGGIGTTILYVIGGILVIGGAAAILIKRKKDSE